MRLAAGLSAVLIVLAGASAWGVPESPHHRVRLQGHGQPTVIFEAGLGDTLEVWNRVQPVIASSCARTLAYNRAGYAGSDPTGDPRDAATIVAELRAELKRRNVDPPYVLVGHSLGGLYMQYFARNYPHEIAGLVLVDSTHWNQGLTLDPSANAPYAGRTAVTLFMPWIMRRELADSSAAGRQVHQSPQASSIPTVVLSSARMASRETPEGLAVATRQQNDIAADFPGARHIWIPDSGHYIQQERPDAVVSAVRELAGCGR